MSVWGITGVVVGIVGGWLARREWMPQPARITIMVISAAIILFCLYMIFARVM